MAKRTGVAACTVVPGRLEGALAARSASGNALTSAAHQR